jgi:hypothetical protein
MAKKHHKHKNWLKALEKDAEHLGDSVEKGMADAIKLAVEGTEFATKFALLPFKATIQLYKALKKEIKAVVGDLKHKDHSDNLDDVDHVLNSQDAAIQIKKKTAKSNTMFMYAGIAVVVVLVIFIISKARK